jgi:hypothetical protein
MAHAVDLSNGADFLSPAEIFTRVKTALRRRYIIPFGRSNIDARERPGPIVKSNAPSTFHGRIDCRCSTLCGRREDEEEEEKTHAGCKSSRY